MIEYTYEKYAIPRIAALVEAGMPEPAYYAIPDEIVDAVGATSAIAQKSIASLLQDIDYDPTSVRRTSHRLDRYEMLQTVIGAVNSLRPEFAAIVEKAADEGLYVLEQMDESGEAKIPIIEEIPALSGRMAMLCETEGTISSFRVAMNMAGRLVGSERSQFENATVDQLTPLHVLSLYVQGNFFERLLFDITKKHVLHTYTDADANLEKRTSAANHMSKWLAAMRVHRSAISYASSSNLGSKEQIQALSDAGHIHNQLDAPALLIATALYDVFSQKSFSERNAMLDQMYPQPGQYPENYDIPPLATLLTIAGVKDAQTLNQVFVNAANTLFPISPIVQARETFGLLLPTGSEIVKYNH